MLLDEEDGTVVRGGTARKRPSKGDVVSACMREVAGFVSVPGIKGKNSGIVPVSSQDGCRPSRLFLRRALVVVGSAGPVRFGS